MASLKGSRLKKRLVLDIGSSAVRLCELTRTKTGFQLTRYMQRDLGVLPSAPEPERQERIVEVINEMLKEAKIRARRTVFGVPGQSVFTRTRALPPVPEHKVSQIVRYEIQQQIPFSLDQIALDYQILSRTEAGGYEVLMAAIKVDVVDKRLDIIKKVKRAIGVIDVSPIAEYNWLKTTGEFGVKGECVAMIDLGASTSDIVIEREGQFRFTRSLNLGGNDVTSAISNTFGISFEEAERLKCQRGFAPTGDPQRDGKGGEVIGQVLNRLVTEINRSFAYFRSQPGGGPVSRVVITGGGACLRNIIPYLQRQLNMEVRIAQPLTGLAITPAAQSVNEHPEQSAVVLGLALRNCAQVPISVNLIPPRIIEGARRKQQYLYWAASLAVVLAIFATIIPDMRNKIQEVEKHTDMARDVIGKYDPKLVDDPSARCQFDDKLSVAQSYIRVIKNGIDSIDNFYDRRKRWLVYLNALNDTRQKQPIWFTQVFTTTLFIDETTTTARAGMGERTGMGATATRSQGGLTSGMAARDRRRQAAARAAARDDEEGANADEVLVRRLMSSGFAGITWEQARDQETSSRRVTGSVQPRRSGGGQSRRRDDDSGGPVPANVSLDPNAPIVDRMSLPNGIEIHGYAADQGVVLDYLADLKERDEFVEVYLDERSVNQVSAAMLGRGIAGLPAAVAGSQTVVSFVMLAQISGAPLQATEVGSAGRVGSGTMGTPSGFVPGGFAPGAGLRGLGRSSSEEDEDEGSR
ncbi:MAG TPA: type IV pilus assembly protein PilM [Candidatus Hydrogenedentes bacterium]|nr:type IV pilus assembly protein PilM [Candidatus Hydrogenedentota bacterium]HQH67778.1 type IV pilus assembly protein PilM [Candidatus Hydrogenedentota bacterium]HQM48943.1 type IV pilus assembly protein PilM [Candidatus Hydrogenedentota bacterium]